MTAESPARRSGRAASAGSGGTRRKMSGKRVEKRRKRRRFDYEISKTSVNDSNIAGYLRTECGVGDICAGTLFPALAQRFSQGVVNIKTHTITFPHVRLEQGKVVVVVDSRIDAFVSQPDRNRSSSSMR
ncbi:Protein C06G1.1 a [Aphelenchoides avenae]|nr:Protein C06G1.1 a [Aphelenchus avenae]